MTSTELHNELRSELMDKLGLSTREAEQYMENKSSVITQLNIKNKSVEFIADHLMALAFAGK